MIPVSNLAQQIIVEPSPLQPEVRRRYFFLAFGEGFASAASTVKLLASSNL